MDLVTGAFEFADEAVEGGDQPHLRTSVRFPMALPVRLIAADRHYDAVTDNLSASGILFHLNELIPAETAVEFLIEVPEGMLGPNQTAAVHCTGRIIRSYVESSRFYAAAVIDEYSFV